MTGRFHKARGPITPTLFYQISCGHHIRLVQMLSLVSDRACSHYVDIMLHILIAVRGNCARISPLSLPQFSSIVIRAHCNLCIGWDHRKAPIKIASLLSSSTILYSSIRSIRGHSARVVQSHTCLLCSRDVGVSRQISLLCSSRHGTYANWRALFSLANMFLDPCRNGMVLTPFGPQVFRMN